MYTIDIGEGHSTIYVYTARKNINTIYFKVISHLTCRIKKLSEIEYCVYFQTVSYI